MAQAAPWRCRKVYKNSPVIDFHVHIFPDELAYRAVMTVLKGDKFSPFSDGTLSRLLADMDERGVDISVVQPIITKQHQLKGTNTWASSVVSDRVLSFGGIYPHTDDYRADIDFVRSLGLRGLKFHAEYQDFVVDAPEMIPVYRYAASVGLPVLFHGGEDLSMPGPFKSSPAQYARINDAVPELRMIVAHLGGFQQWDDVERYLAGRENVWLDTSMGFTYYPHDQFLRILEKHGEDRMLFASDSPWSNAGRELETLFGLVGRGTFEKIAYLNAKKLLGL